MEKLSLTIPKSGSAVSPPSSSSVSVTRKPQQLPKICNPSTDVDLPRAIWSAWVPAGEPRKLRRALMAHERHALEQRRDELAPFVGPFDGREETRVALWVTKMFGSFPSMRQADAEMAARANAVVQALAEFPAWAIEKACHKIQLNGVWRDGKYDTQWPPSDAEIARAVREEFRLYGDTYRSAVALLNAEVER